MCKKLQTHENQMLGRNDTLFRENLQQCLSPRLVGITQQNVRAELRRDDTNLIVCSLNMIKTIMLEKSIGK